MENNKLIHRQVFLGAMNTVLTPELLDDTQYRYMLNCDILSSSEGNLGAVMNVKGNILVDFELPEGENKCIGVGLDEESNKLYYAVWNSLGYNSWYQYDAVSNSITKILQCITDTGGVDIFKWSKTDIILHVDIVDNDLLYWAMSGHPARKFNISKALNRSPNEYGEVIAEEFTRAYKRTSPYPPECEYFTNDSIKNNSVYGSLFQFTTQYTYDDGELSEYSDYSSVPIPAEENITGVVGVPSKNNGIYVRFLTGGVLVKKITIAMRKTNIQDGGATPWVKIITLDKELLNIPSNSEYTYEFYNNNTYLSESQELVIRPQSYLPRNPKVQAFADNTMIYGNFTVGFPNVKVDIDLDVDYDDLFIPDGTVNELNKPYINTTVINTYLDPNTKSTVTVVDLRIGPDVKKGNIFNLKIKHSSISYFDSDFTYVATANDNARTVAAAFGAKIATTQAVTILGGYVGNITVDGTGFATLRFAVGFPFTFMGKLNFTQSVVPVYYSTLKDTGNSVKNEKLGSAFRYALVYRDEDGRKSLAFGDNNIVEVKTINELGGLKKVSTILTINHKAPYWAKQVSIVRTNNLSQSDYIQMLIQNKITVSTVNGEQYHDLIIGSLFAYQQVHPNATLRYEFKKGDRVRLQKNYNSGTWSIPSNVVDYEVLDYFPEVRNTVNQNIKVNGTSNVTTDNPDSNNIGNNISINGHERTIVGVTSTAYVLDAPIATGLSEVSEMEFPAFDIINTRGVLRLKINPLYPIDIDPAAEKFALVEVYTPYQSLANEENENYYYFGYTFDIVENNGEYYHRGNIQDQTSTQPAKIKIEGFNNYVRNRGLITNMSVKNPQAIISSVEDASFSDFYYSKLSSYGRATRLDDSTGEVYFEDRLVFSSNYIEDTRINGLNMFANLDRVDYSDKYGSINRIIFYEGRLYIFKFLKTGWVPVRGVIIQDQQGSPLLAASADILPPKMEYFLWEGGVGNNPESVVKDGNDIFGVSPNSGVIFRIGGNGVIPISKDYGVDNEARLLITEASKSNVRMYGAFNRKKALYTLSIEPYETIAYNDAFNSNNMRIVEIPVSGIWQITTPPDHGEASILGDVLTYASAINYSGMDYLSYRAGTGVVRNICINILGEETELVWKATGEYCVVEGGSRTGYKAFSILQQYNNISGQYTGVEKPNISSDPDYVAPIEDLLTCPLGVDYIKIGTIDRSKSSQAIAFVVTSVDNYNIIIKEGNDFSGTTIIQTGMISSGTNILNVPSFSGVASIFLEVENDNYAGVSRMYITDSYLLNANFNELSGLTELILDQSSVPDSHNHVFNSLSISSNVNLQVLRVVKHQMASFNLTPNVNLEEIDLSFGSNLVSLTIGSWDKLRILDIYNCLFTSESFSSAFIDSIIATYDANVSGGVDTYRLRYGTDNNSGVKPSPSVLPQYNSLIGKSIAVIGKSPEVITSVYLTRTLSRLNSYAIRVTLTLSNPLPVDITIRLTGQTEDDFGFVSLIDQSTTIFSGILTRTVDISSESGRPILNYFVDIDFVTPNPAGGININY